MRTTQAILYLYNNVQCVAYNLGEHMYRTNILMVVVVVVLLLELLLMGMRLPCGLSSCFCARTAIWSCKWSMCVCVSVIYLVSYTKPEMRYRTTEMFPRLQPTGKLLNKCTMALYGTHSLTHTHIQSALICSMETTKFWCGDRAHTHIQYIGIGSRSAHISHAVIQIGLSDRVLHHKLCMCVMYLYDFAFSANLYRSIDNYKRSIFRCGQTH